MQTFEQYVQAARRYDASDIHISVGFPVQMRVDGEIRQMDSGILSAEDCEAIIFPVLNDVRRQTFESNGEVDFAYELSGLRLRVNIYRESGRVALAARLIKDVIPPLSELGLPECLSELQYKRSGLILVTGITGSGKSTTMASLVNIINQKFPYHIITLEEPIEYVFPKGRSVVHQREIGSDTLNFPSALRAAMRQDPDVILLGEMRDPETMATAITAAETGHLVLSTLHTMGAANTVDRIIDSFPAHQQQQVRMQLADILVCVISQRLIPRTDGHGRAVATEVMFANSAIRNNIRESKTFMISNTILASKKQGMVMMDDSIAELYARGIISRDDALLYAQDREALQKKIF